VRLWDAATGRPTFAPAQGAAVMRRALISPDGRSLVAVGKAEGDRRPHGEIRVWLTAGNNPVNSWRLAEEAEYAAFSPDGRLMVVEEDGAVRVWDPDRGEALTPPLRTAGRAQAAFSRDGRFLLTAGRDGTARLWDLELRSPPSVPLGGGPDDRPFVRLQTWPGGDGKSLLSASGPLRGPSEVRVWDTESGKPLSPPLKHATGVNGAALGPQGRVATLDRDGHVRLWDRDSGHLTCDIAHKEEVKGVGFADGGHVLSVAANGGAAAWDADGAALPGWFSCGPSLIRTAFSGDGRRLATVHGRPDRGPTEVRLWDTATGTPAARPVTLPGAVAGVALTADGSRLLTTTGGWKEWEVRVWDTATGQTLSSLRLAGAVIRAAISPDGRLVAAFGPETRAAACDASTGEPVVPPLAGLDTAVPVFYPGGLVILSEQVRGGHVLRHLPLAPSDRPLDELERLAAVVSGDRIDAGAPVPLTPAELRSAWEALNAPPAQHPE
jgi:WD40 repeat protein